MVKIFSSMMAAMGKQLKQSVNVFHSLMLYLLLPVCQLCPCSTSNNPPVCGASHHLRPFSGDH